MQDAPFRSLAFNSKSSSFVVVGGNSIRHWCVQPVLPEHRHDTQSVHTTLQQLVLPPFLPPNLIGHGSTAPFHPCMYSKCACSFEHRHFFEHRKSSLALGTILDLY